MPDRGQEKPPRGLARSIDALFQAPPAATPAPAAVPASYPAPNPIHRELPAEPEPAPEHDPELTEARALEEEAGRALDGQATELARRIVAALGRTRAEEARERLIAAAVLLGPAAGAELSDQLAETQDRAARRAYLDALIAMGGAAMPFAKRMLDDDRWWVVRNGLSIVGRVDAERPMDQLVVALGHPQPKVRREAVAAIARTGGGADAEHLLVGMLEDPDPAVRKEAALAAGEMGIQRAHRSLVAMLAEESEADLLVAVLRALGQLGDPGAVPAIERHAHGSFLRRPPLEVRIAAYRALRHIGTPRARRLLNQAVDDRDPTVKQAVRQLLGMA